MKQSNKISFLILIVLSISLMMIMMSYAPIVQAQGTTGLSAMTMVSFDNSDSSSPTTSSITDHPIENKTVSYFDNSTGYLVYPSLNQSDGTEKLPAVVLIHENKGLNDFIKESANLLARNGYVVLAADLFNGEVTADQDRSRELTAAIRENPDIATNNLKAAVAYLQSLDNVNPSEIASLGWCFGGQQSLQLALNSKDNPLAATVIYYGRLSNDTQAISNISWPILGIFGDKDQSIPVDSVNQFQKILNETGIENEIYVYPNVGHAFANPSNDNYAANETADAWKKTLGFLDRYLKS
ncbi:dienelactone hydrolase family protein [Candidatus Nitrosocosmicus hydrocola]|jgi:carboxymethylenebutenolidase|uniref:dienelactone hydrolase family protein n=1 Tax=Candidatus Nitrosocosmicus hydrocola TaxID=1826872 RepID=UPI0011E58A08|nr:dienelactone hydrolase family protein [Candidatus Nitrosocosmicus hydrocola]